MNVGVCVRMFAGGLNVCFERLARVLIRLLNDFPGAVNIGFACCLAHNERYVLMRSIRWCHSLNIDGVSSAIIHLNTVHGYYCPGRIDPLRKIIITIFFFFNYCFSFKHFYIIPALVHSYSVLTYFC